MSERADHALRAAHMLRVQGYLSTATASMWASSSRAAAMFGMAEASLREAGPVGGDEEMLQRLDALIREAREYYDAGDFPAMMARMRVANDLTTLRIIELAGEQ